MQIPTDSMEVLSVGNLRIVRGGTVVLKEVSWRVRKGEHWVIMGANGSGKTSLLSALTGFFVPTSGSMSVLGRVYGEDDWSGLKRVVGLVSSSLRQMISDEETAIEVLASGLHGQVNYWGHLTADSLSQAESMAVGIGCGKLLNRQWAVLSQGERQRVLIGRALLADPQILILDEPCAGLDPAAREQFLAFLEALAQKKSSPSLILVTHHVEEIMPSFTHLLGLREGRVMVQGPRGKVLDAAMLSRLFRAEVQLTCKHGRYLSHLQPKRGRKM